MYSGRPTLGTEGFPHTYDLGLKGLALTITDRDIEGKPVPGIAYYTHICSMQVSFQKYIYPAQSDIHAPGPPTDGNG
jgi:hypothetical protein